MKESLFSRHTATLFQYIGIGLISGAISHGFFSGFRSLVTAVIGIIVFIAGLAYERQLSGSKFDMGKVLLIGIIFSISTAMVAGGFQHFLDSPWRSAWIIPVGYFISVIVFREKEGIKDSLSDVFGKAMLVTGVLFIISYPLAQITPAQFDHHDESTPVHEEMDAMQEHCKTMPEMSGCEKYVHKKANSTAMMQDHGMMMDHASMVTSEETFVVNMIPHHQEAVDTARFVVANGSNPELKTLAQNIIDTQIKEISMMNEWVKNWKYVTTPSYQNMMGDGTKLSGKELDRWFLSGMIMHHEGALEMAKKVLTFSPKKEIRDFADQIIRLQTEEILSMKLMLREEQMSTDDTHGH